MNYPKYYQAGLKISLVERLLFIAQVYFLFMIHLPFSFFIAAIPIVFSFPFFVFVFVLLILAVLVSFLSFLSTCASAIIVDMHHV